MFRYAALALLIGSCYTAAKSAAAATFIYSCEENGKVTKSDHPFQDCHGKQIMIDSTGHVTVVPRAMSPAGRQRLDECMQERERIIESNRTAGQADRLLVSKYPDKAVHAKARDAALADVLAGFARSDGRLAELELERKPLDSEAEFFKGREMPLKLKNALDANDAAVTAQRDIRKGLEDERIAINGRFDVQLARLTRLWSGGPSAQTKVPVCVVEGP